MLLRPWVVKRALSECLWAEVHPVALTDIDYFIKAFDRWIQDESHFLESHPEDALNDFVDKFQALADEAQHLHKAWAQQTVRPWSTHLCICVQLVSLRPLQLRDKAYILQNIENRDFTAIFVTIKPACINVSTMVGQFYCAHSNCARNSRF